MKRVYIAEITFHPYCRYQSLQDLPKSASIVMNGLKDGTFPIYKSGNFEYQGVEIKNNHPDIYHDELITTRFYFYADCQPLTISVDNICRIVSIE